MQYCHSLPFLFRYSSFPNSSDSEMSMSDSSVLPFAATKAVKAEVEVPPVCGICMDDCNKTTKKAVACAYCENIVCRACLATYLTQDTAQEPACPGCRAAWDSDFLSNNTTAVFRNGPYKAHRAKVLLDREKARLAEAMPDAEAYRVAKEKLKPVREQTTALTAALKALPENIAFEAAHAAARQARLAVFRGTASITEREEVNRRHRETRAAAKAASKPIYSQIRLIQAAARKHFQIEKGFGVDQTATAASKPKSAHAFIHKCPAVGCAGFLKKETWRCGICEAQACKECHEIMTGAGAGHSCNPDILESVKALAKESKPCPKCAAAISKISGCDQMWCTQCQTAFSWRTGAIETVIIHNPHYFEWRRNHGGVPRAPGDIPCNAREHIRDNLDAWMREEKKRTDVGLFRSGHATDTGKLHIPLADQPQLCRRYNLLGLVCEFFRKSLENAHYATQEREALRGYEDDEWRRVLRVRRLVGEIDEATWAKTLTTKERSFLRTRARMQLSELFSGAVLDILSELAIPSASGPSVETLDGLCKQLAELLVFMVKANATVIKNYSGSATDGMHAFSPNYTKEMFILAAYLSEDDHALVMKKPAAYFSDVRVEVRDTLAIFKAGGHDPRDVVSRVLY